MIVIKILCAFRDVKTYQFVILFRIQNPDTEPCANSRIEGVKKSLFRSKFAIASDAIILLLFIAGAWICQHPDHPLQP